MPAPWMEKLADELAQTINVVMTREDARARNEPNIFLYGWLMASDICQVNELTRMFYGDRTVDCMHLLKSGNEEIWNARSG
jgi:hypothetical protein